jgi:hypothetical protein
MGPLYSFLKELLSLFVDDGYLALAIVVWVALIWLVSGQLQHFHGSGLILFVGLAGLLVESAHRRAARH